MRAPNFYYFSKRRKGLTGSPIPAVHEIQNVPFVVCMELSSHFPSRSRTMYSHYCPCEFFAISNDWISSKTVTIDTAFTTGTSTIVVVAVTVQGNAGCATPFVLGPSYTANIAGALYSGDEGPIISFIDTTIVAPHGSVYTFDLTAANYQKTLISTPSITLVYKLAFWI